MIIYNYLIIVNNSDDIFQNVQCANSFSDVWLVEFELNLAAISNLAPQPTFALSGNTLNVNQSVDFSPMFHRMKS